jgi:prophage antirepressor-like protein
MFITFDNDNNIFFKLRDILKLLGYEDVKKLLVRFDINKKYTVKYIDIVNSGHSMSPIHPSTRFINESGLYILLTNSRKNLAKNFRNELFANIIPQIRKTGSYSIHKNEKSKLEKLNKKLHQLEKSNKNLKDNQKNIIYPIGPALYIIKKKKNNKTFYKIGYTKNLNKRLKTYNTSDVDKIYFSYYILLEDNTIDKCIKQIIKNEEYIKNKEFYKSILQECLKFIIKCNNNIKYIYCGYCLKKYKLNNIINHSH